MTRRSMQVKVNVLVLFFAFQTIFFGSLYSEMRSTHNDWEYVFSGVFKPESFYAKNANWLNNDNDFDKSYYSRGTFDLMLDVIYGQKTYETKVAELLFQVRNKGVWGNAASTASTTESEVKIAEAVTGFHTHGFPRMIFWIRQLWLQFNIGEAVNLPFTNVHTFTLGAFPFQLGRGISLGDAYAVGQGALGFYADSAIDQYAFGTRFSGELVNRVLSYDLYTAILQNNSTGLADTSKKILGQEYGRLETPERGFGKVNFLMAGRFNWNVFDNEWLGRMTLEPYALYNSDPEQRIEFAGDATSRLGTLGLAGEFYGKRFEAGFEYAANLGQQFVKGWDRNIIKAVNRDGVIVLVNDNVNATYTAADGSVVTEQAPYVPGGQAQSDINKSFRDESQNSKEIGTVAQLGYIKPASGDVVLTNSKGRFGDPYTNKYEGWMFVADASYGVCNNDLIFAATVGVASGDDVSFETDNGEYSGFISLQEVYSGKRVRSVFTLGGAGKLKRLFTTPQTIQAPGKEARGVSGFTNLIFVGNSLKWKPKAWKKPFELNPNVLAFWQETPTGGARTFLGVESALFINYSILKDLKLFWVSSLFFPGSHYKDRSGTPVFTPGELVIVDNKDVTGFNADRIAKLGCNVAYSFNAGLIYSF
jgi:hypothetical protein